MGSLKIDKTGTLVTGDEIVIPPAPYYRLFTSLVLLVEAPPVGANLQVAIQDISGALPTASITARISDGELVGDLATGSVPIAAQSGAVLRIVSAPTDDNAPSFLQAFLEFGSVEAAGTTFATLGQLKAAAGETGPSYDGELSAILLAVTRAMQNYMGRLILPTIRIADRYGVWIRSQRLALAHYPILTRTQVTVVTSDGTPITDFAVSQADADQGFLFRQDGWPLGYNVLEVTYESGYDPTPADLAQACIDQSRLIWKDHAGGGNRFGEQSRSTEGSGSAQFMVDRWHPRTLAIMNSYRRLV